MLSQHSHKFLAIFFSLLVTVLGGISGCSSRTTSHIPPDADAAFHSAKTININKASASELETLPHVGPVLAARIVAHRDRYGPFRRLEHLLAVEGISEARFRELKEFIDTK